MSLPLAALPPRLQANPVGVVQQRRLVVVAIGHGLGLIEPLARLLRLRLKRRGFLADVVCALSGGIFGFLFAESKRHVSLLA
jgi:hypothetical protein